jgi:hypothetical protein
MGSEIMKLEYHSLILKLNKTKILFYFQNIIKSNMFIWLTSSLTQHGL